METSIKVTAIYRVTIAISGFSQWDWFLQPAKSKLNKSLCDSARCLNQTCMVVVTGASHHFASLLCNVFVKSRTEKWQPLPPILPPSHILPPDLSKLKYAVEQGPIQPQFPSFNIT